MHVDCELFGMQPLHDSDDEDSLPDLCFSTDVDGVNKDEFESDGRSGTKELQAHSGRSLKLLLEQVHQFRKEGSALVEKGEVSNAARCYERALQVVDTLRGKSNAGDQDGQDGANIEVSAEEIAEAEVPILTNLALCYLQGQPPQVLPMPANALRCCEKALDMNANSVKALFRKGKALSELGRHDQAQVEFSRAAKLEPKNVAIRKELQKAKRDVSNAKFLSDVNKYREDGNAYIKEKNIRLASCLYEQGLRLLWGKDEPPTVEELESESAKLAKGEADSHDKALRDSMLAMLLNLAFCYLRGDPPEFPPEPRNALGMCELALTVDPNCVKALFRKGLAFIALKDYAQAEKELVSAVKLAPKDVAIRRELDRVRAKLGVVRLKERQVERETYCGMFEQLAGFATPEQPATLSHWPEDVLPAPSHRLGTDTIQTHVEELVTTLTTQGKDAYVVRFLNIIRHATELEHGQNAGKQLARIVPLVQSLTSGRNKVANELSRQERHLVASLDGLPECHPFLEVEHFSWCSVLTSGVSDLREELRQQDEQNLWECLPEHRNHKFSSLRILRLVKQGVWLRQDRFQKTRRLLSSLEGMHPYEISILQIPAHTRTRLFSYCTNFVLCSHLALDLQDGAGSLQVGDWIREWRRDEMLVFDESYPLCAVNNSNMHICLLVCHFYHPDLTDVERYALLFLSVLTEYLQQNEMYRTVSRTQ